MSTIIFISGVLLFLLIIAILNHRDRSYENAQLRHEKLEHRIATLTAELARKQKALEHAAMEMVDHDTEVEKLEAELAEAKKDGEAKRLEILERIAREAADRVFMDEYMDQRDAAQNALSQAYYLITGKSPQWSDSFGPEQAVEEIDITQRLLRDAARSAGREGA